MKITYYDEYTSEWVSCPLSSAPDVFVNPSATREDIRKWHAEQESARLKKEEREDWENYVLEYC